MYDVKQHRVVIQEYKDWNTKTIYNRWITHIYRRCPKVIQFRSPMVNDHNQHLCGWWTTIDTPGYQEATIQQLIDRRKPFAVMHYGTEKEKAQATETRLRMAGLDVKKRAKEWHSGHHIYDVLACQRMTVKEIGDLEALKADYEDVLAMEIDTDAYADLLLSTFFAGRDVQDSPLWLKGLILGFPIENTISIYRQQSLRS
ncbi:MAG: hypothetical protein JWL77_3413 [Chthonomonadaceae bacterium]|nr:hypothetical protein [Chthonomonadaceae bacterium]